MMRHDWINKADKVALRRQCVLAGVCRATLYARQAQGKTRMSALGACMRRLVHLCYGVMKSGRDYEFPMPKFA
jgi:hypothetical protein